MQTNISYRSFTCVSDVRLCTVAASIAEKCASGRIKGRAESGVEKQERVEKRGNGPPMKQLS